MGKHEAVYKWPPRTIFGLTQVLRTFARKSSNIDFFIKLLPQLGYELLLSEKQKHWGVTDFVSEIRYLKGHPNLKKTVFLTRYGSNVCMSKNIANESLEQFSMPIFIRVGLLGK